MSLGKNTCFASQQEMLRKLNMLHQEDRDTLEKLFRLLIINYGFGYTLFGDKPMTFNGAQCSPIWVELAAPNPYIVILREGFEVWNRYKHLFPSENYIFNVRPTELDGTLYHEFYIVNIESIKRLSAKHSTLFPPSFSSFDESDNPSSNIEQKILSILNPSISSIEQNTLMGILFGFGKNNSCLYTMENELALALANASLFPKKIGNEWDRLDETQKKNILLLAKKPPLRGKASVYDGLSVDQLITRYQALHQEWKSLEDLYPSGPLTLVPLPGFIANRQFSETQELYDHYYETQKKLMKILQAPNFLELFLIRLTEEAG